ncbi:hypothetical protein ACQRIT_000219 [Beauveria bassiana]
MLDPLYASVMCGIVRDQGPESRRNDVCARRSLENVLSEAFQRFQLEFRIGFEVEFEIWRPNANDKLVLHSTGLGGSACSGLRHAWYDYVEEAMLILLEAGVGLEGMHTEGQQGQFEFNLGPKPPMEAVDELVFVHDTLKRVFAHHGTFTYLSRIAQNWSSLSSLEFYVTSLVWSLSLYRMICLMKGSDLGKVAATSSPGERKIVGSL